MIEHIGDLFYLDEEGRRSVGRRGWLGHYLTGLYRTVARPAGTRIIVFRAQLLNFFWDASDVAIMLERLPQRYINPVIRSMGATIADDCTIGEGIRLVNVRETAFRHLKVGYKSWFARRVVVDLTDEVIFGDRTAIGLDSMFITQTDLGHTPLVSELIPVKVAPIRIGRGAFIGPRAIILNGVTVGECAVIGANSVVIHDIPPYTMAVGAPAKVIRELDRSKIPPFDPQEGFIIPEGTTG